MSAAPKDLVAMLSAHAVDGCRANKALTAGGAEGARRLTAAVADFLASVKMCDSDFRQSGWMLKTPLLGWYFGSIW
jgi:hypothetical protein